jgi:hypothetical protein
MSDLFSSLLIFTIIKTILSTFFLLFLNFTNLVKWALTEMLCGIAGTTTLDENVFVDDTSIGEKSNEMNSLCNMINTDLKKMNLEKIFQNGPNNV